MSFTHARTLQIEGLEIHLYEKKGTGTPIFFLHGYMDSGATFHELVKHIPNPCFAWDARGYGKSSWLKAPGYYHFYDYVYDLHQVIQTLDTGPVILWGHSMGGMAASLYAGTFGEEVKGFINMEGWIVSDTDPELTHERVRQWVTQRSDLKLFRPYSDLASAAQRLQKQDPKLTDTQVQFLAQAHTKETKAGLIWRHDPLHRTRSPQPFRLDQARAFWSAIEAPTLLMYGEDTQALKLPDWNERLGYFPDAQVEKIKNAGHNLHLHQAQDVAEAGLSWLRENQSL